MKEKPSKPFLTAVDKIVSGRRLKPSEYEQHDKEDQELLSLAQVLAEGVSAVQNDELADDELDMVAGGVNPNALPNKKDKP